MRWRDLRVCHKAGSEVTISPTTKPAPSRRQSWRKGRSVTPAMGARMTRLGKRCRPICGNGRLSDMVRINEFGADYHTLTRMPGEGGKMLRLSFASFKRADSRLAVPSLRVAPDRP